MVEFKGHGPSKVKIIDKGGVKIARKYFPETERDRCFKESDKMIFLKTIGKESGVFNVPEIYEVEKNGDYYDMEYLQNVKELNDIGFIYSTADLRDRILKIIDTITPYKYEKNDLWEVMLSKFKQLKTGDVKYIDFINNLPKGVKFNDNCYGYCHGDLTFDNILIDDKENKWYLIDAVWSYCESPLWDVGKILQSCLIRWNSIRRNGKLVMEDGWLAFLNSSVSYHAKKPLLEMFIERYGADAVLLATACQLARVSRWCYPHVLIPIIDEIFHIFFHGRDDNTKTNRFSTIIERILFSS